MSHWLPLPFVVAVVLCAGLTSSHAQATDSQQKLESLLRRYPDADANKDGKLSEEEAREYATKLRGKAKASPTDSAQPAASPTAARPAA